jgi:hypothetical protein
MAQAREIRADSLEDGFGGRIVEQREEQVLHGHELVAGFARPLVALADGLLEIFAEHMRWPPTAGLWLPFPDIGDGR